MASPLSLFIDREYSSVYAYAGVAAVRSRLVEEGAIVVWNEDDTFLGVLTPADVVTQPHYLVIDCLRDKPALRPDQSITEALRMMVHHRETVLPVVDSQGKLAGLLHQHALVQHLLEEYRPKKRLSPPPIR